MITKLKMLAMAMLLTGATVTAANAATLYQSLSVDLTLTYQGPATTNAKTGTITDVKESVSLTTPKFLEILATNLGVTLNKGASLIKATTLADGINFTNVITNSTTLVSNATFFETNITSSYVYTNNTTNGAALATNMTEVPPSTNYHLIYVTNAVTNLVQGTGNDVILGTNVQYFLNNGPGLNSNNFVLINGTNDNAGATMDTSDDAWLLHSGPVSVDAVGHVYYGIYPLTNFFLAQNITNHEGIFAGSIKTDLAVTGTFTDDNIEVHVGPPREAIGSAAPANLNFSGSGAATATTATVGSGKSAMPVSSWNVTFDVTGSGSLGGTVTNTTNGIYLYTNGSYPDSITETTGSGFPYYPYSTNPPPIVFDTYTNIATNFYTNYSVINPTNTVFSLDGTVKQNFLKLAQ